LCVLEILFSTNKHQYIAKCVFSVIIFFTLLKFLSQCSGYDKVVIAGFESDLLSSAPVKF